LFDASPNSFLTLPNSPNLLPASNQLTIGTWIKPDFNVANQWDTILAKRDGCGAPGNSYNLGINKGDPNDIFGAIAFAMSSSSGEITRATSGNTAVPDDGQFHHVAATYDGSVMRVYLDGQLVGQAARSGPILATTSAAVISHHGGSCGQRAVAAMDEIELYDRALLAAEVQSLFLAGSAGKCTDETPPTFGDCPTGGPFLLNSGSQPVGPIAAEDPESGIDTENSLLTGAVDTSAVGPQTVTFIAFNTEGAEATQDCDYDVHYSFSGFFEPIDNTLLNAAKAGQTIPVKWRLTDATGAPVAAPQSFVNVSSSATPGACGGTADAIETYAGASGLQYLGDGYWQFNWKTPKAYAGQCRTMSLTLQDGASGRTAAFIFK
jgi:hypothetical protein